MFLFAGPTTRSEKAARDSKQMVNRQMGKWKVVICKNGKLLCILSFIVLNVYNPPCKDGNVRFTTIPLKSSSNHYCGIDVAAFLGLTPQLR